MWEWVSSTGASVLLCGSGALLFLILFCMVATEFRRQSRVLATMKRTPTSRVANAQPGLVELVGVAASAGTLVTAPLSGAPCVYFHVVVEEASGSSRSTIIDFTQWRDFYLDDGSGAVARLTGDIIHVLTATRVLDTDHADAVQRFLASRGISKSASDIKQFTWFEERIDAGAPIYVLGEARAALPAGGGGAYRADAARERFTVVAPEGGELVVSVGSEAELAAKLRRELSVRRLALAILAVSAVACTVGLIALLAR
jgi:hypothetical protein